MIQFTLDVLPPSANTLFPSGRNNRRFKSFDYLSFQYLMRWDKGVRAAKPAKPLTGRLLVQYNFYRKDKRKFDIANLEKALSDTLTDLGFWEDDSQICDLTLVKFQPAKENMTEVIISEL